VENVDEIFQKVEENRMSSHDIAKELNIIKLIGICVKLDTQRSSIFKNHMI